MPSNEMYLKGTKFALTFVDMLLVIQVQLWVKQPAVQQINRDYIVSFRVKLYWNEQWFPGFRGWIIIIIQWMVWTLRSDWSREVCDYIIYAVTVYFPLKLLKNRVGNDSYVERGMQTFNNGQKSKEVQSSKVELHVSLFGCLCSEAVLPVLFYNHLDWIDWVIT